MLLFAEAHPRRTAARKERELLAGSQTRFEFPAFLGHGEVRAEGRVVHFVEAQAMHHRDETVHHVLARGEAESVAYGRAYGRSHLGHDLVLRIGKSGPYFIHGALDGNGARGTDHAALAAAYAVGFGQTAVVGGSDQRGHALAGKVQGVHGLNVVAHAHAVAAEYALARRAHDAVGAVVHIVVFLRALEAYLPYAHALGQVLQMTVAVLVAYRAVAVVGGEQKLQQRPAVLAQFRRVGLDVHAVARAYRAGGEITAFFVLDRAQSACAVHGKFGNVAERGQIDARLAYDRQHIGFIGEFDADAVYDHAAHG